MTFSREAAVDSLALQAVTSGPAMAGSPVPADPDAATPVSRVDSLIELIRERRLISAEAIARAELVQAETGEAPEAIITRLGLISEQLLAKEVALALGLPLVTASDFPVEKVESKPLSADFLHDRRIVPIAADPMCVTVAAVNPLDPLIA